MRRGSRIEDVEPAAKNTDLEHERELFPLTRVSHTQSTAEPESSALTVLPALGLLDVAHDYASGVFGRNTLSTRYFLLFATTGCEKSWLRTARGIWYRSIPLLFCLSLSVLAQDPPEKRVMEGQQAIYRLDFERAAAVFHRLSLDYPASPVGPGMESTVKWNVLLFAAKNLTLDDYATPTPFTRARTYKPVDRELKDFLESNTQLLDFCGDLLKKNPRDIMALYFRGMAYENAAAEALAIRRRSGEARALGKKAKNLHQKVLALDPEFVDANTSIAVYEFAAATLPWSLKWLAFLLGVRGDKSRALRRLELVSQRGLYRRLDAQVIRALLQAWKGDPRQAAAIFEQLREQFPENFLLDINLAAIYENLLKERKSALRIYQNLLLNYSRKAAGLQKGEIYYRIGRVYIALGEYTLALKAFERALNTPRGELETEPLSYFHIARIHETRGESELARSAYGRMLLYQGPRGGLTKQLKEARRKLKH
ncbi:MAG: tetratricopeptide repeat protein [Acidobacteriota bacterium]